MTKYILLFCLLLVIVSCRNVSTTNKKRNFNSFVFSYSALHSDYSLRITESDTVYFIKRFPKPVQTYYSILLPSVKDSILQLISDINFIKYDSIYDQTNLEDGDSYKLVLNTEKNKKWIYIHGYEAPEELYKPIKSIMKIKEGQAYKSIDTIIDFDDLKYISYPSVPAPPLKY